MQAGVVLKAKLSFIKDFQKAMDKGFIPSHRKHNTGIGKTFEDIMNVEENNSCIADYEDIIELKSQREYTESMISLFTKAPSHPKGINTILREKFGEYNPEANQKELHTTIKHSCYNSFKENWGFKTEINENKNRIELKIKKLNNNRRKNDLLRYFIEQEEEEIYEEIREEENLLIYWTFEDLKEIIENKCQLIAYITADTRKTDGVEKFHFTKAILLSGFTFEKMLRALYEDKLLVDIRLGSYKSGKNKGKKHDHGTGFRMNKKDLPEFFEIEEIENIINA